MTEKQRDEILLTILKNSTETKEKIETLDKRMETLEQNVEKELEKVKVKLENLQFQITSINGSVAVIEVEHGEKLDIIFNAISIHTDKFNIQDERISKNERRIEKYADKLYLLEQKVNK